MVQPTDTLTRKIEDTIEDKGLLENGKEAAEIEDTPFAVIKEGSSLAEKIQEKERKESSSIHLEYEASDTTFLICNKEVLDT